MKTIVIAIGGNSLIKDAQHMSVPDQYAAVVETARHITDLLERRYHIVVTHGNGRRSASSCCAASIPAASCTRSRSIPSSPTRRARSATKFSKPSKTSSTAGA